MCVTMHVCVLNAQGSVPIFFGYAETMWHPRAIYRMVFRGVNAVLMGKEKAK